MPRSLLILALVAAGCTNATSTDKAPRSEPTETRAQPLGEATQAYWFEGNGAGPMPSYPERVAWHFINQVRMNTDVFDVRDMDGNLIPPAPPMVLQPGMVEVGRWQGAHALQYTCYCATDPMSMMPTPAAAGSNPFSCCTIGYVNGTVRCVGPLVACGDEGLMAPVDRWGTLNRGPGEIRSEVYWTTESPDEGESGVAAANWFLGNALGFALGERTNNGAVAQVSIPLVPDECLPPEDTCGSGDCLGPNGETACDPNDENAPNECIGQCDSGPKAGEFCTIPEPLDPNACNPDEYPRGYWWSFMFGQTSEPTPFINDVIHTNLEEGAITLLANYFDPVGEPQLLQIATANACNDMQRSFMRPGEGMGGADAGADGGMGDGLPYAGNTYQWDAGAPAEGCIRYIAYAVDAEGFTHTYPTFGSLGMKVAPGGVILPNDDVCPIWEPESRPDPACLPAADECAEGATRVCYTGRPGTEDKGVCDVGTETCRKGRWSGLCEGETRPEATETCGNDEDDNCNGHVDEDCPVMVDPTPPDAGGSADAGGEPEDMGGGGGGADTGGGGPDDDEPEDKGCCATAGGRPLRHTLPLGLLMLGALAVRRGRR